MMIERSINILLVEDDPDCIAMLQRVLNDQKDRYKLDITSNLTQAKGYLSEFQYDILISKMGLPDGDGTELVNLSEHATAVLIMIPCSDDKLAEKILKAGAVDYFVNSYEYLVDLPHIIERTLRHWDYIVNLRKLSKKLTTSEQNQRHQLARDLHDRLGQNLAFSKMMVDRVKKSPFLPRDFVEILGQASDKLENAIGDVHNMTYNLSFPTLHRLGLVAALEEWLKDEVQQKHKIQTVLNVQGQAKQLENDIRFLVFRSVRELVINSVKHAMAKSIKVSLANQEQHLEVIVEDDGIGFCIEEVKNKKNKDGGFGLFSISERLKILSGCLEINSNPGQGTKAVMIIPA